MNLQMDQRAVEKTPDLRATENNETSVGLLEVKTIWRSDYEMEYMTENTRALSEGRQPRVRRLQREFSAGLQNKLKHDLENAVEQLSSFDAPDGCRRIVLFLMELDHAQAMTDGFLAEIRDFVQQEIGDAQIEFKLIPL